MVGRIIQKGMNEMSERNVREGGKQRGKSVWVGFFLLSGMRTGLAGHDGVKDRIWRDE